ncbi:MAG: glycoside hydrolase family 2 TIM barrel-domain containing protein, partial [Bacteroidales bacterium]
MNKTILCILLSAFSLTAVGSNTSPDISVAGLIDFAGSGREVIGFNPGWRFVKGDVPGAQERNFNDTGWSLVSLPHTVELMPAEASGCRNYQGPAWYRKRFVVPASLKGKNVSVHFEAAMGKKDIYVDGNKVSEHFGGYLPFNIDLTAAGVQPGDTCQLAVFIDNSNDKAYPPGKPQYTLDFAYHGGIYRDAWLIGKSPVAITDPVAANKVAGGGVFVHYDGISEKSATVFVNTDVKNDAPKDQRIVVENTLLTAEGKKVQTRTTSAVLKPGESRTFSQEMKVNKPSLWSPSTPYLYRMQTKIRQGGNTVDGGITRIGIRKAEFKGKEGFWLNGKPYGQLIGANRHQDFGYVGNAIPNSQQYRDALKLREAGCTIIRSAHYPQDPAFMDACDELGLFVIVATPGWQYWNKAPQFKELVHQNTREMIRRDRNHPSVLMWEPILNETRFPLEFSLEALQITKDEFPYPGRPVAVADLHSAGVAEHYDVVYGWPKDEGSTSQCIFTREFGENVDDWYAHNNNNRASRSWGERPMAVQALSLAKSYDEMFETTGQFIGGAQWHPFDHQRGYHPDPYWGGQFDCFRQPKYTYQMFRSQTPAEPNPLLSESGPMTYIMHEISPFSDRDVTVFSNCDSVRLIVYGTDTIVKPVI